MKKFRTDNSTEDFYKNKKPHELASAIKKLYEEMLKLKKAIEHPENDDHEDYDKIEEIYSLREQLQIATLYLSDTNEKLPLPGFDVFSNAFEQKINNITEISLETENWIPQVQNTYEIHITNSKFAKIKKITGKRFFEKTTKESEIYKDHLFYQIKNLYIDEWLTVYDPERFGYIFLDGCHWELTFTYCDGNAQKFTGNNSYPYNFILFLKIFDLDFEKAFQLEMNND